MSRIVVIGGGFCGLGAAQLFARDGHDVVVLDREGPPPMTAEAAFESWDRRSVGQFRMVHLLVERGFQILSTELPEVIDELVAVGAWPNNALNVNRNMGAVGEALSDDDRFDRIAARRPVLDLGMYRAAAAVHGLTVRHHAVVTSLETGVGVIPGVPHVNGVRLASGEKLAADLVVDMSGRRGPTVELLTAIGARSPTVVDDNLGFSYVCRHYRSTDGATPFDAPSATRFGCFTVLAVNGDNGTWSLTVAHLAADAPLRRLREPSVFDKLLDECGIYQSYLLGEPLTDPATMSGTNDRERTFVVDGVPVATGIISVGDAWACTNPSIGRGMTFGMMHAQLARDAARSHLDRPAELAAVFHESTMDMIGPWHASTHAIDRGIMLGYQASIDGIELPSNPQSEVMKALTVARNVDLVSARAANEINGCLALPQDVFSRPGLVSHIQSVAQAAGDIQLPTVSRARVLEVLDA